jgi:hypothetical protein
MKCRYLGRWSGYEKPVICLSLSVGGARLVVQEARTGSEQMGCPTTETARR